MGEGRVEYRGIAWNHYVQRLKRMGMKLRRLEIIFEG